jgi:hypothetical protein
MNEGLEALASLASASPLVSAPSSQARGESGPIRACNKTNENPFSAHGSHGEATAFASNGSTAAATAGSHPHLSPVNRMQALQNGQWNQFQQGMQQQSGSGMNPSALSNSSLALLLGMQQRVPQADPLASIQQQLSHYGYGMNSQPGYQMSAGAGDRTVPASNNATNLDLHQALAFSLAIQAHQRSQQSGKFLFAC